jgi:hypothetical protein
LSPLIPWQKVFQPAKEYEMSHTHREIIVCPGP